MYVRYQGTYNSTRTGKPCGIFAVVSHMKEKGLISPQEREEVRQIVDWFEEYLPNPPFYKEAPLPKAITWFKQATSAEMLVKIERIKAIVETNGWQIDVACHQEVPGQVIYEDDYQIATL